MRPFKNLFNGGMDRDTARTKYNSSNYYYASNAKVITTDDGLVTGDLTNEDGNLQKLKFPILLYHTYRFRFDQGTGGNVIFLVGNSMVIQYILVADDYTQDTFYTALVALLATPIANGLLKVFKYDDYVHVMAVSESFSVSCSYAEVFIKPQTSIEYRGHIVVRDTIVLFTRSTSSGTNSQISYQIWKVNTTDKGTVFSGLSNGYLTASIHLVYNNPELAFTNDRKVTGKGNYETPEVIKVYFTDFDNNLRQVNIADSDTITYTPNRFAIVPSTDLSQTTIVEVRDGGNYTSGAVQYSYCLFNPHGAQTVYSPVSPMAYLSGDSIAGESYQYKGDAINKSISKAVKIRITELDKRFSHIRIVALHYASLAATPSINIVRELAIPESRTVNVVDTGASIGTVTLSEFSTIGSVDFKCKTMETKQNILFPMNVEEEFFDVTGWDARAYRFNGAINPTAAILGADGVTLNVDANFKVSGEDVPEDHDCVQTYTFTDTTTKSSEYRYNLFGNFGGSGPNITYEIVTHGLLIDKYGTIDKSGTSRFGYDLTDSEGAVLPQNQAAYTGYQRGEVYRFGIVFFNTKGQHSFVQWIADIRMPYIHEINPLIVTYTDFEGVKHDFATYYRTSDDKIYANVLGLIFRVNTLPSGAVGYRIVRCERTNSDKSILSQGLWTKIRYNRHNNVEAYVPTRQYDGDMPELSGVSQSIDGAVVGCFMSPEVSFNKNITFQSGDYLQIVAMAESNTVDISESASYGSEIYTNYIYPSKFFNLVNLDATFTEGGKEYSSFENTYALQDCKITGEGYYARYTLLPSYTIANHVFAGLDTDDSYFYHGWTMFFSLESAVDANHWGTYKQYNFITNYCRLVDPYGGNSYEARSLSTYIPAGQYETVIGQWKFVYGGDTFIDFFDCMTCPYDKDSTLSNTDVYSDVMLIPVETTINLPLRYDSYFNSMRSNGTRGALHDKAGQWKGLTQSADLYLQNDAYSRTASFQSYIPRPLLLSHNEVFDHRIYASLVKSAEEIVDSWTIFLPENKVDVEGEYGAINAAAIYEDKLFFLQSHALGVVSVNERILTTPDDTGASLTIGKGGILDDFRYITTRSGCMSQDHVYVGGVGKDVLYYIDINSNSIMVYTDVSQYKQKSEAVPLTTLKGMNSYLEQLGSLGFLTDGDLVNGAGALVSYYPKAKRVMFTFSAGGDVVALGFNELMQSFEGFYGYGSLGAIRINNAYYSVWHDPNIDQSPTMDTLWLNGVGDKGNFFGSVKMSEVISLVNPPTDSASLFTNIQYELMVRTSGDLDYPTGNFYDIRVYNDYQDTGLVVLNPMTNCRKRMRTWHYIVPRNAGGTNDRIRSSNIFIHFRFQNADNKSFIMNGFITWYNEGGY